MFTYLGLGSSSVVNSRAGTDRGKKTATRIWPWNKFPYRGVKVHRLFCEQSSLLYPTHWTIISIKAANHLEGRTPRWGVMGLAKMLVQLFIWLHLTEKPNWTFWPPQYGYWSCPGSAWSLLGLRPESKATAQTGLSFSISFIQKVILKTQMSISW